MPTNRQERVNAKRIARQVAARATGCELRRVYDAEIVQPFYSGSDDDLAVARRTQSLPVLSYVERRQDFRSQNLNTRPFDAGVAAQQVKQILKERGVAA